MTVVEAARRRVRVVLPGGDPGNPYEIAAGVRRQVAALDLVRPVPGVPVTARIGVAVAPGSASGPDRADLLREADRHLDAAKAGGRNRVEP